MIKGKKIKIVIADDHSITRDGIKILLKIQDDIELIGEASNGKEAIELCSKLKPDVVLMDLQMPLLNGIDAIRAIREKNPGIKLIALTSFADKKLVGDALRAGAISYIVKNISPEKLIEAIKSAFSGETYFSPEAARSVVEEMHDRSQNKYNLTDQELKILSYVVQGFSNKKIASELVLSHNTIKFHISNILSKLRASSRAQAAVIATKEKLLD
jgi:NarL family two-component system response regulator LiaR